MLVERSGLELALEEEEKATTKKAKISVKR